MRFRVIDFLLLGVILAGVFFAVRTGRERQRLAARVERLSRKAGDLTISDPSRVYVQALPTQEPLDFAWRMYLPPNYNLNVRSPMGGHSSSISTGAHDYIARVRFREDRNGLLHVYMRFAGGSSRSSLGDNTLTRLLHDHWDKIQVKQLGAGELSAFATDQSKTILELTLPDDLQAEAQKRLSADMQKQFVPVLFKVEMGPEGQPVVVPGSLPWSGE